MEISEQFFTGNLHKFETKYFLLYLNFIFLDCPICGLLLVHCIAEQNAI